MNRFYGLSDTDLDHSKVNQQEIRKYENVILLSVDVRLLVQREKRLSGRNRNVKGSMLGRFSQQKEKSFFISLTLISGSCTHTHTHSVTQAYAPIHSSLQTVALKHRRSHTHSTYL